jgi:hypothetical protein
MKKASIILLFAVAFLFSCFSYTSMIRIINRTNNDVIVCYSYTDSLGAYIDNLTINEFFKQFDDSKYLIINGGVFIRKQSTTHYKIPFRKQYITDSSPDGKVRFYFVNYHTFLKNPWDSIVKHQMYEKKLVFSKKDLEHANWEIKYD